MRHVVNRNQSLIRIHLLFSGISFLLFSLFLILANKEIGIHYFHSKNLAITHIATLCWFTTFLFAIFYQYTYDIFERKLYSVILAKISFWLLAAGSLSLVVAFWLNRYDFLLTIPAHFLLLPFLFFFLNVMITAIKSGNTGILQWYFISSSFWLFFTAVLGFLLAMNFGKPIFSTSHLEWLKLHANIGFVGWFIQFIISLTSKQLNNSEKNKFKSTGLNLAFFLINGGLLFYFFYNSHNTDNLVKYPFFPIISGIIIAIIYIFRNVFIRRRNNTHLIVSPFFIALVPVALSFFLILPNEETNSLSIKINLVYGISILFGFVALWIFNQYETFIDVLTGKNKEKLKNYRVFSIIYIISYLLSILLLISGILSEIESINFLASCVMLFSVIVFNIQLFRVLFFKTS